MKYFYYLYYKMGVSNNRKAQQKYEQIIPKVNRNPKIEKEATFDATTDTKPIIPKKEIDNLFLYESAICKIKFESLKNGQIKDGVGTGFFFRNK